MIKLGYNFSTWFHDEHTENFHRALDEIALSGWDGVEIFQAYFQKYHGRPKDFKRLIELHGLELSSYYHGCSFIDKDRLSSEIEMAKIKADFVVAMGASNMLLDGGRKRPEGNSDDDVKIVAETANKIGEFCKGRGIHLSWHQHWGSMFDQWELFEKLMAWTDPELIGFCPDTAQLALSGFDVVETIRRYAHRIRYYVHFKDVEFRKSKPEVWPGGPSFAVEEGGYGIDSHGRMIELGRGVIDFFSVWSILRDAGFDGWIVDDHDFTAHSAMAASIANKTFLTKGLGIQGRRDRGM